MNLSMSMMLPLAMSEVAHAHGRKPPYIATLLHWSPHWLVKSCNRWSSMTTKMPSKSFGVHLSVADTADFGILRLVVDDTDNATRVLKEGGFTVGKTDVVAVEVADKPGGLARV